MEKNLEMISLQAHAFALWNFIQAGMRADAKNYSIMFSWLVILFMFHEKVFFENRFVL